MPLSHTKQLMNLVDEHGLGGDQQSALGKAFSLSGESYLFEFYSKKDAEEIVKRITFLGIDEALKMAYEGAESNKSIELTHNDDIVNTEVVDEDGEVVVVTQELRESFLMDHGKVEGAFWQVAFALAKIKGDKSYLAGGFGSFNEYISKAIPLQRSQAYAYLLVGEKFRDYEQKILDGDAPTTQITKAKMIASQSQEEVKRLMEKGTIAWGDDTLTKDELENETITSLRARLKMAEEDKAKAEEKSQKAELLEEKLKNANMEKEDLEKFRNDHLDRVDQEAEMKDTIEDAWHHVTQARKQLAKIQLAEIYKGEGSTPDAHDIADSFYRLTTFMEDTAFFARNSNIEAVEEYLFLQENDTEHREAMDAATDKILSNRTNQSE